MFCLIMVNDCHIHAGAQQTPPPPPLNFDWLFFVILFCIIIRMLQNKTQIAWESILNTKASTDFLQTLDPGRSK